VIREALDHLQARVERGHFRGWRDRAWHEDEIRKLRRRLGESAPKPRDMVKIREQARKRVAEHRARRAAAKAKAKTDV
jgi:hypothetical protein